MGKELSNVSSIGALGVPRNAVNAGRVTATTDMDDDENGGSADGRKFHCVIEQKDTSTERTGNNGLDVNDREKDMEEEGHNIGKLGHEFSGALPDMNTCGGGIDDSLTQRGRAEKKH